MHFKYVQWELVFSFSVIIYDLHGVMEIFNSGIFYLWKMLAQVCALKVQVKEFNIEILSW
jgi:hypothetical protein